MRPFLIAVAGACLALVVLLALVAREPPDWVPGDTHVEDTLVPESADVGRRHYTPDTLALRPITSVVPVDLPAPYTLRWRAGISVPDYTPLFFDWPAARPGWYLNWNTNLTSRSGLFGLWQTPDIELPDERLGMEFTPMVHMRNGRLYPDTATLRTMAADHPGLTWLIGNEPDVKWQDNTPPEVYAIAYHRAYHAIKAGDPSAQVAIGGVSQITPLRLAYLSRAWDFYQQLYGTEMPVDIWNMHAFVLREDRNTWGVNIPPGFEVEHQGQLWDVEDHDNLALVERQIHDMRLWMAERGQQNKPLWITEYGILMPEEYGFTAQRVIDFMTGSFDLFLGLRDPALGLPEDDYRLVQRWNWYPARDSRYSSGNLFDDHGQIGPVGKAMFDYLAQHED